MEDIWLQLMWQRCRRFAAWTVRRIRHPITYVLAGILVLLIIADQLYPRRMAEIALRAGDGVFFSSVWVGDWEIAVPLRLQVPISSWLYEYAANRHVAQGQARAAAFWLLFRGDEKSVVTAHFWLYGAYAQGNLRAVHELSEALNKPQLDQRIDKEIWEQPWIRTPDTPQSNSSKDADVPDKYRGVVYRLNYGALAIGARKLANPGVYGWAGRYLSVLEPIELNEMVRRARKWFDFNQQVTPAVGVDCDSYRSFVDDVIAGRLHNIRTCIDQRRNSPMSHETWQRFLTCAHLERDKGVWLRSHDSGIRIATACAKAVRQTLAAAE